jgi:ATP-dependent protease ClpP protease subunit
MTGKNKETLKRLRESAAQDVRFYLPESIMSRWHPDIQAANDDDDSTINVYDIVGEDWWTGQGMTAKIVSAVLRRNRGKEVTVNINSPGGDFFEGLAIYNLLKEHDAPITVRVVGMAASAASVIAMAGTTIKIAEAGFFMIHNAWHVCVGNKHDMHDRADVLAQFDDSMVGIYAKKTGKDRDEITDMMDAETWISGADAVKQGFASQFLDSDELDVDDDESAKFNSSLKEVEMALAKAGKSRSQRRHIIKDLTSTPGATVKKPATPCAGDSKLADALASFTQTLKT